LISPSGVIYYKNGGELIYNYNTDKLSNMTVDAPEIIKNSMKRYQWHVLDNISKMLKGEIQYSLCYGDDALETIKLIKRIINK
jgi:hypothetical protein